MSASSSSDSSKEWTATGNCVAAIRDVENIKDTKRMAKQLNKFGDNTVTLDPANLYNDDRVQHVSLSLSELKRLVELAKGSKAKSLDLHIQTDKPALADLYPSEEDDRETCGKVVIAPRIDENGNKFDRGRFQKEDSGETEEEPEPESMADPNPEEEENEVLYG